jgi:glyoxylase-like metal-dependent hydrolase (beta-lactamase superfamily II)
MGGRQVTQTAIAAGPTEGAAAAAGVPGAITYLHETPPDFGQSLELIKDLTWLRLPLPFVLNHVNCWLLDNGPSWTLIDTGADRPEARAIWEDVLANRLAGKPVDRIICTHGHPDHIGLAGWLCDTLDVRLHMTLAEWLAPQLWREQGMRPMSAAETKRYAVNGVSAKALGHMMQAREAAPFRNHPLPMSFKRIRDGEILTFGQRQWQVLVNGGHAEEHASFYCAAEKILIAGDQILPRISPVVGVYTSQPWSDPLGDYLASLKRLATLPPDTLVLPSHGLPFHGLHARIQQLEAHHAKRLDQLVALLDRPMHGVDMAKGLFTEAVAKGQLMMALAETMAHANHLVTLGRVICTETPDLVTFARA